MSRKRGRRALLNKLLASLSLREQAALASLLNRSNNVVRRSVSNYLESVGTVACFGVLHKEVFGDWDYTNQAWSKVLDNLDKVKDALRKVRLNPIFTDRSWESVGAVSAKKQCPEMPLNLRIANSRSKEVVVSRHAWQRFWERFYNHPDPDKIAGALRDSFSRSEPTRLSPADTARRIIHNDFEEAQYLVDQGINCRFVVTQSNGRQTLRTVEKATGYFRSRPLW